MCDITTEANQDCILDGPDGVPDECQCPGDFDLDGDVDLADLAQLLSNYGTPSGATYYMGDMDCDGDIDLSDLAAFLAHFGANCDPLP